MTRRNLTALFGDGFHAEFSGYGSRELDIDLKGRPPVYNTRTKRWTAQPRTLRDLIALAESRAWDVTVLEYAGVPE